MNTIRGPLRRTAATRNVSNLRPDDYKGWTEGIAKAGYATGATMPGLLQKIIEQNGLDKYDRQVMQEMAAQGKQFGLESNPLQEKRKAEAYSFPVERKEFSLSLPLSECVRTRWTKKSSRCTRGLTYDAKAMRCWPRKTAGRSFLVNGNANSAGGKSVTVEYSRPDGSKVQCTYMHLGDIAVKAETVSRQDNALEPRATRGHGPRRAPAFRG